MRKRRNAHQKNSLQKNGIKKKAGLLVTIACLLVLLVFWGKTTLSKSTSKTSSSDSVTLVKNEGQTYAYLKQTKLTGLQKIKGSTYYFDTSTGKMKTGLLTLDKGTVYFSPETGKMQYGLKKIDGYYYYFTKKDGTDDVVKAYQVVASKLKTKNQVIEGTIAAGLKLVGKSPYVYGGGRTDDSVANNEFDCSSFIAQMYRLGGQSLVYQFAASTTLLAQTGTSQSWIDKTRGDLLITPDDATEEEQHAAIYLGGGFILHDSTSTNGVNISRLNQVINSDVLGTMTWGQLFEQGHVRREV